MDRKWGDRVASLPARGAATDNEYEAFRSVSDNRGQAIKIELRFKNGDAEQFEYSYLVRTRIRLSEGLITLRFTDATVTLRGRNLTRLRDDLRNNKVEWIQELETPFASNDDAATVIEAITIEDVA